MSILPMALTLVGGLALFMYGMERSSESIQRAAGERLQSVLNMMTKNSIVGVLTGAIVTIMVQSSSATTVMLITFVNAGLLSLTQAIGVIMGANIGTTLTGWIIAAVGIAKFSIISLAVPLFGIVDGLDHCCGRNCQIQHHITGGAAIRHWLFYVHCKAQIGFIPQLWKCDHGARVHLSWTGFY